METKVYDFGLVGGDMRQVYLAEDLSDKGYRVCCLGLCREPDRGHIVRMESLKNTVSLSDTVIAPIPLSKNNRDINHQTQNSSLTVNLLLEYLQKGQSLFAGCIPEPFRSGADEKGVFVCDLMEEESLAVYNSIATAEGAISEAISNSAGNLHKSRCAVFGYGKCAKTLVRYLKGMFCHVTVYCRSSSQQAESRIEADGAEGLKTFENHAKEYDYVFNTIPKLVIDSTSLKKMKKSATIIDIASAPGGVDFETAGRLGLSAHLCPGLPGKYAPRSSAEAIAETIIQKILSRPSMIEVKICR